MMGQWGPKHVGDEVLHYCNYNDTCAFVDLHYNRWITISGMGRLKFWDEYVEIKCQLGATEVFIADLIACSTCFGHHYAHHQELKSSIQWLLPVVFRAVIF